MATRSSISAIVPQNKVISVGDVDFPFDIKRVTRRDGNKYGGKDVSTWRLYIVNTISGEEYLMFFQGNSMRDEQMEMIGTALDTIDSVGPCVIETIPLPGNQKTYNIIDAPTIEAETTAKAKSNG